MSSWRPILRLARRDARRHLLRTILAAILIALPVAALVTYTSSSNPGLPPRDRVLASIPDGAEAIITATAIPQGGAPFPQVRGRPGTMDGPSGHRSSGHRYHHLETRHRHATGRVLGLAHAHGILGSGPTAR